MHSQTPHRKQSRGQALPDAHYLSLPRHELQRPKAADPDNRSQRPAARQTQVTAATAGRPGDLSEMDKKMLFARGLYFSVPHAESHFKG